MKRMITVMLSILAGIMLCACSQRTDLPNNTEAIGQAEEAVPEGVLKPGYSFENAIDDASEVFEGVCIKKEVSAALACADMSVSVEKVYRGAVSVGSVINVTGNEKGFYKEGERYVFFTRKYASVYSGKPLYYFASCPVRITDDGKTVSAIIDELNGLSYEELASRIASYTAEHSCKGDADELKGAYCLSDDPDEIIEYSECIAIVKPEEKAGEGGDRDTYNCTVLSVLKGETPGSITVAAFKNGMEIGEEYVVMVCRGSSGTYLLSSAKSLIKNGTPEAEIVISRLK